MRNMIPDDGWVDYSHLNTKGAKIFSEWLAHRVGQALEQSEIKDPTLEPTLVRQPETDE